mgnify:FL=1
MYGVFRFGPPQILPQLSYANHRLGCEHDFGRATERPIGRSIEFGFEYFLIERYQRLLKQDNIYVSQSSEGFKFWSLVKDRVAYENSKVSAAPMVDRHLLPLMAIAKNRKTIQDCEVLSLPGRAGLFRLRHFAVGHHGRAISYQRNFFFRAAKHLRPPKGV